MIEALLSGTTDPEVLAELARGRLRSKIPALKEALEGSFSAHHAFMITRTYWPTPRLPRRVHSARFGAEIERVNFAPFSKEVTLLETIPGVNRRSAETLIAEIGVDMSRYPSSGELASWA